METSTALVDKQPSEPCKVTAFGRNTIVCFSFLTLQKKRAVTKNDVIKDERDTSMDMFTESEEKVTNSEYNYI